MGRAPSGRERQHVVDALHAAVRAGTLDLAGFDRHLTAALAAPTLADLHALGIAPFQLELRGMDGVATLHADRVVLEFDSRMHTQSVKKVRSPRTVPLPAIAAAHYTSGILSEGLRLRLVGEAPSYRPPRRADRDVNAILLNSGRRREAEAFAAEVNERVGLEPRVPEPHLLPPPRADPCPRRHPRPRSRPRPRPQLRLPLQARPRRRSTPATHRRGCASWPSCAPRA